MDGWLFLFLFSGTFSVCQLANSLRFASASASASHYFLPWNVLMLLMQPLMEDASGNEGN